MARYRVTVDTGGTFSDFVALNEETGKLSIVADGQIERGLSPDELRARLRALVLQKPTSGAAREEMQYT